MQLTCTELPNSSMRERLQTPAAHDEVLTVPDIGCAAELVALNMTAHSGANNTAANIRPLGKEILALREAARAEFVQRATAYTQGYAHAENTSVNAAGPLILSGHQPELFHAGVWIKSFAASAIANAVDGCAVHVLIDNDIVGRAEIAVPQQQAGATQLQRIPFDAPSAPTPFEERKVIDKSLFDSFAVRAETALGALVDGPLVRSMWPSAQAAVERGATLGAALAEARHATESAWGIHNLEIPLSEICQTNAFRRFAGLLIETGEEFHTAYNHAIHDYRDRHRLRSVTHPAPLLTRVGDRIELPFWLWNKNHPIRKPLFLRRDGGQLQLIAGNDPQPCLTAQSAEELATQLRQAESEQGIKLRPRALVTTMYLRLLLSDLFLHGIGGGKYDEVTNELMRSFLGCTPPSFLVVSATYRLPCRRLPVETDDVRQMDGLLRELWFHPDQHSDQVPNEQREHFEQLCQTKKDLLDAEPKDNRKAWNDRLESVNHDMRWMLSPKREILLEERKRLVQRAAEDKILTSREYSFCLFSSNELRPSMTRWIGKNP